MQQLPQESFAIRPVVKPATKATEIQPPISQIVFQGTVMETHLQGAVLEACIQVNDRYLVFMTDDCPYEECLRIYLLGTDFSVLDDVSLGRIYTTGSFQLLDLIEPDTVAFQFYTDHPMSVAVLAQPQLCLPVLAEPRGVYRKPSFSRQLKLRDNLTRG